MPLEYRINVIGNDFLSTRIEQKEGAIRRNVQEAQRIAQQETEAYLRSAAPHPRSRSEVQGHGVHVVSTGKERFAGSFKGGATAVTRRMNLRISLGSNTVADYVEHGTGLDHVPDPHSGYVILKSPGGHSLGPWDHRDVGVHGQIYGGPGKIGGGGFNIAGPGSSSINPNAVWADSVFIPGTRPHPWVQDAFDQIKPTIESLYHDAVNRAV